MLILRDWYHIRKKYYKNTENAKAVYYIKQKLYWENIANVPFLGVRGNIIARYYNRKLIRCYGIFVGDHCKVGEGLKLPHPNGILIGNYVKIGNNCTIFQQTTLGAKSIEAWKSGAIHAYPVLEDGVVIYAGAKVIGAVRVGENTCVGAGSLLMRDTQKNSVYAGIPAKRIK